MGPEDTTADPEIAASQAKERFEIGPCIGAGASSVVYRAFDRVLRIEVVLKVFKPHQSAQSLERFVSEALIGQSLNHPNIVRVHGFIHNLMDAAPALVMESVRGESLQERLERSGPITDTAELRRILQAIAEALAYAHEKGIVHRDVKPSNVLLGPNGEIKLTDFGVATGEGFNLDATATGEVLGSFGYIAPEVLQGEPASVRSDIYSFGALARALCPTRKRSAPEWLESLIRRAMCSAPKHRYRSFDEILAELQVRKAHFRRASRWVSGLMSIFALLAATILVFTEVHPVGALVVASAIYPSLDRIGIDGIKTAHTLGLALGDADGLGRAAAGLGDINFLRFLLTRPGARRLTLAEKNAYFCAAAATFQMDVARYLAIAMPPHHPICGGPSKRRRLILTAILQRNFELVQLLATPSSADPNLYDIKKGHPLIAAIYSRHRPIFELLLTIPEYRALDFVHGRLVLYEIARDRRSSELLLQRYVESGANLNARDEIGRTALYIALMECNIGATARLIQIALSPQARASEGQAHLLTLFAPPDPP